MQPGAPETTPAPEPIKATKTVSGATGTGSVTGGSGKIKPVFEHEECRMYRDEHPQPEQFVVAVVKSTDQTACYVTLPEYDNKEGMFMLSDLNRRKVRCVSRYVKIGRQLVCLVTRVDPTRGYIDLSRKNIKPQHEQTTLENFQKSKKVHSIVRHTAAICHVHPIEIYQQCVWDLYDSYSHALDAFMEAMSLDDPASFFKSYFPEDSHVPKILSDNLRKYLAPRPVKLYSDFKLLCTEYRGVEAIKDAIRAGLATGTKEFPIDITLVSSPLYRITTVAVDREGGKRAIRTALERVSERLARDNGTYKMVTEVKVEAE